MRVVIYIRVSTDEQAKEGFSIEAQKRRLISYADSQDWQVVEIYIDDGYSAKDLIRPAMKQLLADLKEGKFDVVLVYKLDRMTRSTADCDFLLKLFESNKVMFQSATESFETRTATGRLFIRLIADIAQWERENIGERVRFGMEQKALEGKRPGGKYPYAYDSEGNLIPEEAAVLRHIRYLYMKERLGFKSIATKLLQDGVTRRGYNWTASTVALSLENPFYAGLIQYGTKLPNGKYPARRRDERVDVIRVVGSHEPVWTQEEHEEHVTLMRGRSDGGYSRKLDYWFTGLLRCGKCGAGMFGRLNTKRSLKDGRIVRSAYYFCNTRKENGACNMPMFRQSHVEHLVFSYIDQISMDKKLVESERAKIAKKKQDDEKELSRLKREVDALKARLKKWQYMFVNDLISSEDLRLRMAEENERDEELQRKIVEVMERRKETEVVQQKLFELSDLWPALNDEEKQMIMRTTFEEITLMTEEENVKGVKNKYFDARISVKYC